MWNSPVPTLKADARQVARPEVVVGEADVVTAGGWEQSQPPNFCGIL